MTIRELAADMGFKTITPPTENLERQVTGVYTCDLLSHAMAKLNQGDLWVTVHTNLNVIAVASLTDCACVVIPEDIPIEDQTVERAAEKGVVLLSSQLSAARVCHLVYEKLKD